MDQPTTGTQREIINILVAEDPFVRAFVKTYLVRHGYTVQSSEFHDAVAGIRTGGMSPDLLITNRPSLFRDIAAAIPLLYIAAFPDPGEISGFCRAHMLRKPFRPEQLLSAVVSLLGDIAPVG